MSDLVVHAYNVLFGDAVLVLAPDRDPSTGTEVMRSILIDVGNVLGGAGGADDVLAEVLGDVKERLAGRPIDLYVMTHEHLDHVQGLPFAASRGVAFEVEHAWLTASSAPGYYEQFPEARRKRLQAERAYFDTQRLMLDQQVSNHWLEAMMVNNNPRNTRDCIDFLGGLARNAHYVHRETKLEPGVNHSFHEATFSVLAPEADTSIYYGRFLSTPTTGDDNQLPPPIPDAVAPAGVDPEAFRRLVDSWHTDSLSNIFTIDRAANNTSVVFSLEWRGWRLLFTGDAELRSWRTMHAAGLLTPVHFLKVAHHGSHNATPDDATLDAILPRARVDKRPVTALVSTCQEVYESVPHDLTLDRIRSRCDTFLSTTDVRPGKAVMVTFPG
jgi:beta-lactamase superfamily II metal-dependent hydrolase